jgi:hypothetical protein
MFRRALCRQSHRHTGIAFVIHRMLRSTRLRRRRARVRAAQERMGAVTAPRPGPGSGPAPRGPDDPRRARMRARTRAHRSARGPSVRRTIVVGWPPNRPQSADGCHVARDTSRPTDSRASSWLCSHSSAWPRSHCSSLDSWTWRSSPTTSTSTRRLPFRQSFRYPFLAQAPLPARHRLDDVDRGHVP